MWFVKTSQWKMVNILATNLNLNNFKPILILKEKYEMRKYIHNSGHVLTMLIIK